MGFYFFFVSKYKMSPLKWNDDTNNNSFKSHKPKLIESSPPKRSKISLDAQLVGDDFFRTLACDSTIHGLDRSMQWNGIFIIFFLISFVVAVFIVLPLRKWRSAGWLMRIRTKYSGSSQTHWKHTFFQIESIDFQHWLGGHFAWSLFDWDVLGFWSFNQCMWTTWTAANYHNTSSTCKYRSFSWNGQHIARFQHIFNGEILDTLQRCRYLVNIDESTRPDQFWLLQYVRTAVYFFYIVTKYVQKRLNRTKFLCILIISSEPNYVSGSNRPHVLWNRNGRALVQVHIQRFLKAILKKDIVNIDA